MILTPNLRHLWIMVNPEGLSDAEKTILVINPWQAPENPPLTFDELPMNTFDDGYTSPRLRTFKKIQG